MVVNLVASYWNRYLPSGLTSWHICLTEQVLTTRMCRQPFAQNALHEHRQRDAPARPPTPGTFFLVQQHSLSREVHVVHTQAQQFASPGTRVSRQANHRIKEWLCGTVANVLEQIVDFGPREKQAVPKL